MKKRRADGEMRELITEVGDWPHEYKTWRDPHRPVERVVPRGSTSRVVKKLREIQAERKRLKNMAWQLWSQYRDYHDLRDSHEELTREITQQTMKGIK